MFYQLFTGSDSIRFCGYLSRCRRCRPKNFSNARPLQQQQVTHPLGGTLDLAAHAASRTGRRLEKIKSIFRAGGNLRDSGRFDGDEKAAEIFFSRRNRRGRAPLTCRPIAAQKTTGNVFLLPRKL